MGSQSAFLLASFLVAASSWYGGLGPGLLATLLAAWSVNRFYSPANSLTLGIFFLEGILISITSEARYEIEKQKDEFIGFVSHELKNPLATIKGFAELANRMKSPDLIRIHEYGEQISLQSERILELINDLLDITKIEIGKFSYHDEDFSIDQAVREVITHQKIITPRRAIRYSGSSKMFFTGDQYRIRQALINLLTNAIKYSPNDKVIEVVLKRQRSGVLLSFKDYGVGIPQAEQRQIFNRYYRTKNIRKKRSEGLGLGLYITNQIVKHYHGKLWVKSRPAKGSTFYLFLPA